jgi:hypothetical protein
MGRRARRGADQDGDEDVSPCHRNVSIASGGPLPCPAHLMVNPKCAAAFIDSETATLANWRALGKGPGFIRENNFIRYRVGDLKKWRQKREKTA